MKYMDTVTGCDMNQNLLGTTEICVAQQNESKLKSVSCIITEYWIPTD